MANIPAAEISIEETAALWREKKIALLDVRTPEERAIAKIEGSILATKENAAAILSWPKDKAIVTLCHHGVRSLQAASYLMEHGFSNVKSMAGGIDAWSARQDSNVPRY